MAEIRKALVASTGVDQAEELRRVQAYLPGNYTAQCAHAGIVIIGQDKAGWTLDGYVIPRLASGLIFAQEIK